MIQFRSVISPIAAWSANGVGGAALLTFAAVLALGAVAAAFYVRGRHRGWAAAPVGRLFDDLCRAHGLSDQERGLLVRAAAKVSYGSAVFVDPALLDRFGESVPEEATACVRLRERLFGA